MGASSSSSGQTALISASEREAETPLCPQDCPTNDGRQRTHVGTNTYKREDQPQSQVCC